MDLAHFLNERLNLVEYFYSSAVASFKEEKRKIENGEPPYVDLRNPEYVDEPAFLEEWLKADAAITIAGAACLDVLQSTLHGFLDEYMNQIGNKGMIPRLREMGQDGWFKNYQAFFREHLQIEWAACGVDLGLLEQAILTRNDFAHNIDLLSMNALQNSAHSRKYPESAFADPLWKEMSFGKARLVVPWEKLQETIQSVRTLCEYLDRERYELPRRWAAQKGAVQS
jgi:hypothetical protein